MTQRHTVVRVVAGQEFGVAQEALIVRDFKIRLGETVNVQVDRVHEICNEVSGKFRYVVSHVKAFEDQGECHHA
jgi:phenylacetate-CoA ligase